MPRPLPLRRIRVLAGSCGTDAANELFERGIQAPAVGVGELLSGRRAPIEGETAVDLPAHTDEILRSGFPAIRVLPARARRAQLDGYLARIVEHDFPEQSHLIRRPATLRAWLTAYAAATATKTLYNAILDAATRATGISRRRRPRPPIAMFWLKSGCWSRCPAGGPPAISSLGSCRLPSITLPIPRWLLELRSIEKGCWKVRFESCFRMRSVRLSMGTDLSEGSTLKRRDGDAWTTSARLY